jgi:hypothetical protein
MAIIDDMRDVLCHGARTRVSSVKLYEGYIWHGMAKSKENCDEGLCHGNVPQECMATTWQK